MRMRIHNETGMSPVATSLVEGKEKRVLSAGLVIAQTLEVLPP